MRDNRNSLYGMLEQLPTLQLDDMLQEELQKETVDENAVRVILHVLRAREAGEPVEMGVATEQAWGKYLEETAAVHKPAKKQSFLLRAAAVAAVFGVVLLITPLTANAERFYGMLTRWTDSIFEFFDPSDKDTNSVVYEFKTDNPGLQQVYDAVVELGVTDPVVPMWLPEGFELVEIKVGKTSRKNSVIATFCDDRGYLVFEFDVYEDNTTRTYPKDEKSINSFECEGIIHRIMKNNEFWTAIWTRENVECFITVDCQEDILLKILRSIYDGGT